MFSLRKDEMPSKNYSMKSILRSLEVVSVPGLECPHGLQSLGACRDLGLRRRVLGNQASPLSIMNVSTFPLSLQVNELTRRGPKLKVSGFTKSSINDMVRFLY